MLTGTLFDNNPVAANLDDFVRKAPAREFSACHSSARGTSDGRRGGHLFDDVPILGVGQQLRHNRDFFDPGSLFFPQGVGDFFKWFLAAGSWQWMPASAGVLAGR